MRISSRSSRKPSATEAIQNCLNLSLSSCSFIFDASGPPFDGKKEGRSVGGGEGDGESCLVGFCSPFPVGRARDGWATFTTSSSDEDEELESEDSDSEEEDACASGTIFAIGILRFMAPCSLSLLEPEESDESEEELDEAALRLRFLFLFLWAGGLEIPGGIGMVQVDFRASLKNRD